MNNRTTRNSKYCFILAFVVFLFALPSLLRNNKTSPNPTTNIPRKPGTEQTLPPLGPVQEDTIPSVVKWDLEVCSVVDDEVPLPSIHEFHIKQDEDLGARIGDRRALESFCKPYHLALYKIKDIGVYPVCVWPVNEDEIISGRMMEMGNWEMETIDNILKLIKDRDRGLILDIGAHIGTYTIASALTKHHVISIEPISEQIEIMRRSLAINRLSHKVRMFQNGLSDYRAKSVINVNKINKGESFINFQNENNVILNGTRTEEVDIITLDDLLPIISKEYPNMNVHYVKIDVEGFEDRVLSGGRKFFEKYLPEYVQFVFSHKYRQKTKCNTVETLKFLTRYYVINTEVGKVTEENAGQIIQKAIDNKSVIDFHLTRKKII